MVKHFRSPFAYLGLWRNPFGELLPAERAELAVVEVGPLVNFLSVGKAALQFVGDCGYGKTTHLLALQSRFPQSQLVYYPETGPRPPLPPVTQFPLVTQLPPVTPLLIDEAQRMGWLRKRQMLKSPGPVALSSHRDLSPELHRAGYQVWTIDVSVPKSPATLVQILLRRIEASCLSSDRTWFKEHVCHLINEDFAKKLLVEFDSNTRRIEQYLYDDLQQCVQEQSAWPHAI